MFNKMNPKMIVLIGVVFVSFSSVLTKMSEAPSMVIAAYRLGFTVLLLLPQVIRTKIPEIKKLDRKSLIICMTSGAFLALHFAAWITSIKYTSVASSTVLVDTHPIFVVIVSYLLFKEKVTKKALGGIAVALIGSVIISAGDSTLGSHILYGDMLAVAGAVFVAAYFLMGRVVRQKFSVTTYTFLVYASAVLVLLVLITVNGIPLYPYPLKEILIFLALAVFCTLLGHSIFNWALAYVPPTFISTSILGEPVGATLWAILLFGEIPTMWQVVGSAAIVWGIYLFIHYHEKSQSKVRQTSVSPDSPST